MKNKMTKLFITALICIMGMTTFANASTLKKVSVSATDTIKEYKKFRKDAEQRIQKNEERIAELKAKKQEGTQEVAEKYNKKVAELEQKNKDLKKRITEYKADDSNDKWQSFKREFNHDMDELGKAMKDIGTNNVK